MLEVLVVVVERRVVAELVERLLRIDRVGGALVREVLVVEELLVVERKVHGQIATERAIVTHPLEWNVEAVASRQIHVIELNLLELRILVQIDAIMVTILATIHESCLETTHNKINGSSDYHTRQRPLRSSNRLARQ